jgi:hypothetical protein
VDQKYDEDRVLTEYIWRNYWHLMTDQERTADKAAAFRTKIDTDASPRMADFVNKYARISDAAINKALEDGWDAFRKRVSDRVLYEHGQEIVINRCPACRRIVRMPATKLCNWCDHYWRKPDGS